MKIKKLFYFINRTNSILIFITIIAIIIYLLSIFLKDVMSNKNAEKNRIKIINEQKNLPLKEKIKISSKVITFKDYYVFEILNNKKINEFNYKILQNKYGLSSPPGFDDNVPPSYNDNMNIDQLVNLLFVSRSSNEKNILFKNNVYINDIYYYNLEDENVTKKISKNIYIIISEDTNNDKFLDDFDRKDLYISSYNGKYLI